MTVLPDAGLSAYTPPLNVPTTPKTGFQRQTYTWLAQQSTNAIIPNPDDVVIIETQINEEPPPLADEPPPQERLNPEMPAIFPLKKSPPLSFWKLLQTNPIWQHAQQWGLYTGGVAVGTMALSALQGNGLQWWKTTEESATVQDLKIEMPPWWEQGGNPIGNQYHATVKMPNHSWGDTDVFGLMVQPNRELHLLRTTTDDPPVLKIKQLYRGDEAQKSVYYEVKSTVDGDLKGEWSLVWDATTKKLKQLETAVQKTPLPSGLEESIQQCLGWFHSPETLKVGLKQERLWSHWQGLKGSVGLATFFVGLSAVTGAALWQFHKRPKPVKAEALALDALPTT
jgi:hypothetical protein